MTTATAVWHWTVEVVAGWFATGRPLRDVSAAAAGLRLEPAAVRADVARTSVAIAGAWRRIDWLLWSGDAPAGLSSVARAQALVAAYAVEQGRLDVAAARRLVASSMSRAPDLEGAAAGAARIAAIADPEQRFAMQHSLPDWAARALLRSFAGEADDIARALAAPPPRTLRTNTLRVATRAELATALAAENVPTRATPLSPLGLAVEGDADLFATRCFQSGWFEQQDEASQIAASLVLPPPRGKVLDLCAGSGGKTLALAATMANRGEIIAADVHAGRLQSLRERARRAGASNVRTLAIGDGEGDAEVDAFGRRADRILVDAPCTGIGSWRRRPEARWSVRDVDLAGLVATQRELLLRATGLLEPGARAVYVTCSLLADENEGVVRHVLEQRPELECVRVAELVGGEAARPIADATGTFLALRPDRHGTDGFFAAVLRRRRGK